VRTKRIELGTAVIDMRYVPRTASMETRRSFSGGRPVGGGLPGLAAMNHRLDRLRCGKRYRADPSFKVHANVAQQRSSSSLANPSRSGHLASSRSRRLSSSRVNPRYWRDCALASRRSDLFVSTLATGRSDLFVSTLAMGRSANFRSGFFAFCFGNSIGVTKTNPSPRVPPGFACFRLSRFGLSSR